MSKLTLQDITAGFADTSKLNANFDLIEAAFENTLSRDGSSPNSLGAVINMNDHQINNLADGTLPKDAINLSQLEDAISNIATVNISDVTLNIDENLDLNGFCLENVGCIEMTGTGDITMNGGNIDMGGGLINNLGDGVDLGDAINLGQLLNFAPIESLVITASDEVTPITAGTAKITFRMPYAFTVNQIKASLVTAQASGSIFTVDVNESGTSILSTKLTIDNTEKTSLTANTPLVISDTLIAADAEVSIDVDQIGNGTAAGLKIEIIGWRTDGQLASVPTGGLLTDGDKTDIIVSGNGTVFTYDGISSFARTLLDDADAATARATLGVGTGSGDMLKTDNLSGLANYTTARSNLGLGALAVLATINNDIWSGTDLAIANGGTGASDAATARTNLGIAGILSSAVATANNGEMVFDASGTDIIVKWGSGSISGNTTATVTFTGTAYSSAPVVVTSGGTSDTSREGDVHTILTTTTTASIVNTQSVTTNYFWIAIGIGS